MPAAAIASLTRALGLTAALMLSAASAPAAEQLAEGIAAQVGSGVVLVSEVMELAAPIEERLRRAGAPAQEIARVRKEALERLIEGRLLSSVVERLELGAASEEVDAAIQAIADDNGLTMEQLLASVTSHGLSVDEYREKIRGEIERSKVVNAMVRSRVQIEEEEVQSLYDQEFGDQHAGGEEVYLRHLVVLSDGPRAKDAATACSVVAEARQRIAAQQIEFGDAARRVSDMNPQQGGELGWMHRTELAGWMADPVAKLSPGELSPVIEMPFGCNLLQLVDRREFRPVSYDDAQARLRNVLFQRKTEEEYTRWLDELRGHTFVERKAAFGG